MFLERGLVGELENERVWDAETIEGGYPCAENEGVGPYWRGNRPIACRKRHTTFPAESMQFSA
jgi:hypothetical protein